MDNIHLLAGNNKYADMTNLPSLTIFSEVIIYFLDALSNKLIRNPTSKQYSDIIAFSFFCRQTNVASLKKEYVNNESIILGRGLTFHIAPSNVPINFAYSLVMGMLSGNACIVRVSSKKFAQTQIVCDAINSLFIDPKFKDLKERVSIVQYSHSNEINTFLSSLCDIRIIWGGDESISEIRKASLPPRSFDITFANRYSVCAINASQYLANPDKNKIAHNFFNDTYLFDQNACSSPRLIYWIGDDYDIKEAKIIFWNQLGDMLAARRYDDQVSSVMNKYLTACSAAIDLEGVHFRIGDENIISRIELKTLPKNLDQYACGGGSFFEYSSLSFEDLAKIASRKFQTITYIGYTPDTIASELLKAGILGIDRVVPCGSAVNFDLTWDGYNLISQMSRVISLS